MTASSFGTSSKTDSTQSLDKWHRRLAHVSHSTIRIMASKTMVDGLILDSGAHKFCPGWAYGKQHRNLFPVNKPIVRSLLPVDLIHTNLCGPLPVASVGGSLYFALSKTTVQDTVSLNVSRRSPNPYVASNASVPS